MCKTKIYIATLLLHFLYLFASCSDDTSAVSPEPEFPDYTLGSLQPGGVYMVEGDDTLALNSRMLFISPEENEKVLTILTYGIASDEFKAEPSDYFTITLMDPTDAPAPPKNVEWLLENPEEFNSVPVYEQHIRIKKRNDHQGQPAKATVNIVRQPVISATCWFTTFTIEG